MGHDAMDHRASKGFGKEQKKEWAKNKRAEDERSYLTNERTAARATQGFRDTVEKQLRQAGVKTERGGKNESY